MHQVEGAELTDAKADLESNKSKLNEDDEVAMLGEAGDDVDSDHHQHQDSPTQSIRESTSHQVDDGNAQHVGEGDGGEEDSLAAHQVKLCYYCVMEDRVIKAV